MKSIKNLLLLVLLLPVVHLAKAQEKYSTVKIFAPPEQAARAQLLGLLEIDHFTPAENGAIIAEISQSDIEQLKTTPFRYEVLVADITEHLNVLNKKFYNSREYQSGDYLGRVALEQPGGLLSNIIATPAAFEVKPTFGGYYSFAEMNTAMNNLVAAYPSIASKTSIGTTALGNDIWLIKISDNVASDEANEPEVLYLGLQHAREAISGSSMIFFMQYLCERYALDTRIQNLVNNREIYIIPCFNPDGWEYNRTSMSGNPGGGWRKNRRWTGGSASNIGVDLNRNWGVDWANCSAPILGSPSSCGSPTQTSDTYWGPSAFSEAETQAVRNFAKAHHLVTGMDQHAYGPYYSLPFGRKSLHPGAMSVKGLDFYRTVSSLMGTYNGMRAGDSYDALGYEVAGGFKDWMLMGELGTSIGSGLKDSVWALTGEGGAGGGTGGTYGSFWPPASQIVNLSRGMCYQNLQMAFSAGTYVDIQDLSDIAVTSTTGSLNFSLRRLGLGNDPVTITFVPIENIQVVGSPVVNIASMPTYYDTVIRGINYILPGAMTNGQRLKYAWQVSTGGYIYSDTVVKFYNPTELFFDNMQGSFATNWTNTAASAPIASGFGYNYTAGNWVFTTSGGYNSTQALSESAAGTNYTTTSQRIAQYNSTFNLTGATATYLTFWTRHEAENFRDKLQVQVSTDGTTWVSVPGSTTVREPGTLDDATINGDHALTGIRDYWTREVFDLSAYNGTAALRLRFRFTSDDDPSTFAFERDEGFFIDDVKVIMSTAALFTLPVKFVNVTGRVTEEKNIKVDWEAQIDQDHRYFEVEKSLDQQTFIAIGTVSGTPYTITDRYPAAGNNYYRIKAVDVNGQVLYSKVINVIYSSNPVTVSIYPNPVKEDVTIKFATTVPGKYNLRVTDLNGNMIYEKQDLTNSGSQSLKVDVRNWASQIYFVTIKNAYGETVAIQKIIKH